MYPQEIVNLALKLMKEGNSARATSKLIGIKCPNMRPPTKTAILGWVRESEVKKVAKKSFIGAGDTAPQKRDSKLPGAEILEIKMDPEIHKMLDELASIARAAAAELAKPAPVQKLDMQAALADTMKWVDRAKKALIVIESLTFSGGRMSLEQSKTALELIFALSHIALQRCPVQHTRWIDMLEEDYANYKKAGLQPIIHKGG
jgi:predicted transcriptional regulator